MYEERTHVREERTRHTPKTPPRHSNETLSQVSKNKTRKQRSRDPSPTTSDASSVPDYHIFDSVMTLNSMAFERTANRIAGSDHLLNKLMDAQEWIIHERQENEMLRTVLRLLRAFQYWQHEASLRAERHGSFEAAYQYLRSKSTARILSTWREHSHSCRILHRSAARACTRLMQSGLRKILRGWCAHTRDRSMLSRSACKLAVRISAGTAHRALQAWSEFALSEHQAVCNTEKIRSCVGLMADRCEADGKARAVAECWRGWCLVAKAKRRVASTVRMMSAAMTKRRMCTALGSWVGIVKVGHAAERAAGALAREVARRGEMRVDEVARQHIAAVRSRAVAVRASARAGKVARDSWARAVVEAWRDWASWRAHMHRVSGRLQRRKAFNSTSVTREMAGLAFAMWSDRSRQMALLRVRAWRMNGRCGREASRRGLLEWLDVADMRKRMRRVKATVECKAVWMLKARAVSGWILVSSAERLASTSAQSVLRRLTDGWRLGTHNMLPTTPLAERKKLSPKTMRLNASPLLTDRLVAPYGGSRLQNQIEKAYEAEGGASAVVSRDAAGGVGGADEGEEARLVGESAVSEARVSASEEVLVAGTAKEVAHCSGGVSLQETVVGTGKAAVHKSVALTKEEAMVVDQHLVEISTNVYTASVSAKAEEGMGSARRKSPKKKHK